MSDILTSPYHIRPASPLIGAEIEGVDLTQPMAEATAEEAGQAAVRARVEHCPVLDLFRDPGSGSRDIVAAR